MLNNCQYYHVNYMSNHFVILLSVLLYILSHITYAYTYNTIGAQHTTIVQVSPSLFIICFTLGKQSPPYLNSYCIIKLFLFTYSRICKTYMQCACVILPQGFANHSRTHTLRVVSRIQCQYAINMMSIAVHITAPKQS